MCEELLTLAHPTVRRAMIAWQHGDRKAWVASFAVDANLYDDGEPRNFQSFTDEIGKEHFLRIDQISADGMELIGPFRSPVWGDFCAYFRFTLNKAGEVCRLEIGQHPPS